MEVIGLNHLNQKSVVNYQISDLSRKLQDNLFIKNNLKIELKWKKIHYIFIFPEGSIHGY